MLQKINPLVALGMPVALLVCSCTTDSTLTGSDIQDNIDLSLENVKATVAHVQTSPAQLYVNVLGSGMRGYVHIDYNDDFRTNLGLTVTGFTNEADITYTVISPRLVAISSDMFEGSCQMNCVLTDGEFTTEFSVPITVVVGNPAMSMDIDSNPLLSLSDSTVAGNAEISVDVDAFYITSDGLGTLTFEPKTNMEYVVNGSEYTFTASLDPGPSYLGFSINNTVTTAGITQVTSTAAMVALNVSNEISGHVIPADGGSLSNAVVSLSSGGVVYYTRELRRVNGEWRFDFPNVTSVNFTCTVWADNNNNDTVDTGDYYGQAIDSDWSEVTVAENERNVMVVAYPLKAVD